MINGIIIISPDGTETKKEISRGGNHKIPLIEFLENNALVYEGYQNQLAHFISLFLASISYLVINVENNRYLYYLGENLTKSQNKWFLSNKKFLKKHKTCIANLNNGEIEYFEETDLNFDGIKGFNKLKKIIEDKFIIEDKEIIENKQKTI